jgi:hypothetical protein
MMEKSLDMSVLVGWALVTVMMIGVGSLMVSPVWANELAVRSVSSDCREAVLVDRATGMEWLVTEGDWVGDWHIGRVSCQVITLTKSVDENNILATQLPVPIVPGLIPGLRQMVPK